MSLRTRLAFAPLAWALWGAAMIWRLRIALDRSEEPDARPSWGLMALVMLALAAYVAWRVWILAEGTEWEYGWRK